MKHLLAFSASLLFAPHAVASGGQAQPVKLAPGAINQPGQITLTPAFTPDGLTAYFPQSECAQIGPCPQTLRISQKIDGVWQVSEAFPLPQMGRIDWPSITPDGKYLLISWSADRAKYADLDVEEDFDLYRLDLTKADAVPEPLDIIYGEAADINRPRSGAIKRLRYVHNETSPQMTLDGDLYFWTERFDAVGERDIFILPQEDDGNYDIAKPLPAPINSTGRDNHAWVSPAGELMFITYNERGGEGRADIFVSRKIDGTWTEPENLGPHLNGPASDIAAKMTPDKSDIVFTSTREGGLLQVYTLPTEVLISAGTLTEADLSR